MVLKPGKATPPVLLPRLLENALDLTLDGGDLGDLLLSANSKALIVPLPFSSWDGLSVFSVCIGSFSDVFSTADVE